MVRGLSRLTMWICSSGTTTSSSDDGKPPTSCGRTVSGSRAVTWPITSEKVSPNRRRTTMRSPTETSSERKMRDI